MIFLMLFLVTSQTFGQQLSKCGKDNNPTLTKVESNFRAQKLHISIICFALLTAFSFGQSTSKTYLSHNHNYDFFYSYGVTEITIHPDSTYTRKDWQVAKKTWKNYKDKKANISYGRIISEGKFYKLIKYHNGLPTDFTWIVKITDRRLIFYLENKKKKLKRSTKYKRIR